MKRNLLYLLLSFVLLFSGCASIKKKLGITQESEPTIAQNEAAGRVGTDRQKSAKPGSVDGSGHRQPIARPDGPLGRARQKSAKDIEYITLPSYERKPEKPLPKLEPIDPKELVLEKNPIMINVDGMPLSDFIIHAIGNTLKVTYFIDESVKDLKAPITLRMAKKVRAETAFEIVIDILRQHDLIVEQRRGSLYILKSKPTRAAPLDLRFGRSVEESEAKIVQLVPLKHIRTRDIEGFILKTYGKKPADIMPYFNENAFLITDTASSIKEIISFIEMFDVPYFQGKKLFMIQLTYWRTDEFIKQLTTIIRGIGFKVVTSTTDPGIFFMPIKYLNSILVIAPDDKTMKVIIEWKEKLDTPEAAGTEAKSFTYKPLYSKASDLVDAIKRLYGVVSPVKEKATKTRDTTPSLIPGLKIEADDRSNLVFLMTEPSTYKLIHSLLKELDTPPRQVLIETTVAELTLTDDLKYGLEWFLKKNRFERGTDESNDLGKNLGPGVETLAGLGNVGGQGLLFNFTSGSEEFGTLMSAFAKDDRINILSRPRLMVLDNEEASIQVGDEISVSTGQIAGGVTGSGGDILTSFQYISTGMLLRVRPTINTKGLLTLNISVELDEQKPKGSGNPDILTRRIKTMVVVATGQSIILGGIMSEDTSVSVNKVPLLGDIPILGYLFKTTSRNKKKTELIITITPTILSNTDDAIKLTDEIKQGLKWLN